jgi:hypothetical protein
MLELDKANDFYRDSFFMMRVRSNKNWWGVFLMTDLSLKIAHECSKEWFGVDPKGNCIKCKENIGFEVSSKGGYLLDYIGTVHLNHSNLYKDISKREGPPRTLGASMSIRQEDPLIDKKSKTTVGEIEYKYLKYKAGFSLILHARKDYSDMHVSTLFLNEGESNLVEAKEEKECRLCKFECRGSGVKSFLILQSNLDDSGATKV